MGHILSRVTHVVFVILVGAQTDAHGLGHIAAVYANGDISDTHSHLPSWLITPVGETSGESPISIYDLFAEVLMACVSTEWLREPFLRITKRPLPPWSKDYRLRH